MYIKKLICIYIKIISINILMSEPNIDELIDEPCPTLFVYVPKNVFIEGNKEGFNSKIAIEKFKTTVKKMDKTEAKINIKELQKYIKPEFNLELVKHDPTDKSIIFKVSEKEKENKDHKKMLHEKIKHMKKNRTNSDYHRAKNDENVTDEILSEYNKLKKISKMPVPEPSEMLANPEQYRPLLNMVLNNQMVNQLGINHPYIRYFKLISEKLNMSVSETTEVIPEPPVTTNKISSNDDDTDEED